MSSDILFLDPLDFINFCKQNGCSDQIWNQKLLHDFEVKSENPVEEYLYRTIGDLEYRSYVITTEWENDFRVTDLEKEFLNRNDKLRRLISMYPKSLKTMSKIEKLNTNLMDINGQIAEIKTQYIDLGQKSMIKALNLREKWNIPRVFRIWDVKEVPNLDLLRNLDLIIIGAGPQGRGYLYYHGQLQPLYLGDYKGLAKLLSKYLLFEVTKTNIIALYPDIENLFF